MPPIAPTPGRIIFRLSESSPSINSLFNSRPTRKKNIDKIIQLNPELVLLGTGKKLSFPEIETYAALIELGIGVDVMDTGAACRTYNILSGEGRRVVAGLIII